MQHIEVVVGGQYGSEAKGHVTAQLVRQAIQGRGEHSVQIINIRVAGPNAGHTVYDDNHVEFKFRQLPVGAVIDDSVICYIAPGSEVQMSVLLDELAQARAAGHDPIVWVSSEATLLEQSHIEEEQARDMSGKIGSTAKGIGAARADRIMRSALRLKDSPEAVDALHRANVQFAEPDQLYSNDKASSVMNQHLIIEGTQGYGLGLHAGHYPQTTSSDCTALDFCAMAQVSPWRMGVATFTVWVVARAFPIRVAGNSGPLDGETTWSDLGLPEEHTTVTNKVRRVGKWDPELVRRAVQANGGFESVRLAMTMADQIMPNIAGFDGSELHMAEYFEDDINKLTDWLTECANEVGARPGAITTGPESIAWVETQYDINPLLKVVNLEEF